MHTFFGWTSSVFGYYFYRLPATPNLLYYQLEKNEETSESLSDLKQSNTRSLITALSFCNWVQLFWSGASDYIDFIKVQSVTASCFYQNAMTWLHSIIQTVIYSWQFLKTCFRDRILLMVRFMLNVAAFGYFIPPCICLRSTEMSWPTRAAWSIGNIFQLGKLLFWASLRFLAVYFFFRYDWNG